ncbi:MAG TPA: alpha/beta fold hydrolase [Longimicrobiales bacterium]|nr:alpha/beta fold hydrolase [Longimicrobiales bacterium]
MGRRAILAAFALLAAAAPLAAQQPPAAAQKFAELGECRLDGGGAIRDCRVGYRTLGTLNADRSNAVLVPTWYSGNSAGLLAFVGPGKPLDPSRWFIVLVDALADGVSSSPSNSRAQPGDSFPAITIRDMVRTQYRLATEVLKLPRLHAVVGLSMGGMQAFQWMVTYPDYVERVVPVVGSPRLTSFDLELWRTGVETLDAYRRCGGCDAARRAFWLVNDLLLTTPEYRVARTPRDSFAAYVERATQPHRVFAADDLSAQARAMMALDVSRDFGGSMERAAAAVRARVLVVVSARDHTVRPEPARAFAALLGAPVVELEGECGHIATSCEMPKLAAAVAAFLER